MRELIDKVWENPRFHSVALEVELAWLSRELAISSHPFSDFKSALQLTKAAAILACSSKLEHRQAAFRVATQAFELSEHSVLPFAQMLRVILARLGNIPSIKTRQSISSSLSELPWLLVAEEIDRVEKQSVVIGSERLTLTPFQFDLWSRLNRGERIALSAPTSAGKSFVLQAFIKEIFRQQPASDVLYLVPTRALISQVSQDFAKLFDGDERHPEIITIPSDEGADLPDGGLYVFTQERAQLMLQAHKNFSADIIIVDEAQSIAEGSRGILLQWVVDDLLQRKKKVQVLFASPTIRNLDVFGRMFGLTNVQSFRSDEPTVSQNFIDVKVETAKKGIISLHTFGDGTRKIAEIGRLTVGQTLASRRDKLVHIPLLMKGNGASIVYANGAAEAEDVALQLAEQITEARFATALEELSALAKEVVHEKFVLSTCVATGVAFHYSNIPTILRLAIENAFKEGVLDYIVCTSTLLQGVNLPAKHIFMFRPEKGRGNPLESTDFWNLSGRAGRLLREFQGNIFLIDYDKWSKHPLSSSKDSNVIPALEDTVAERTEPLIRTIYDRAGTLREKNQADLDSSFLKIYSDFKSGHLSEMLRRSGIGQESDKYLSLNAALKEISLEISLPAPILKSSANISPHRQQSLFQKIHSALESRDRASALKLVPAHPREPDAYKSYERILKLCYEELSTTNTSQTVHRFHALLAFRWMQGWPLPRIIQTQLDRHPERSSRQVIRDTLNTIESKIRFEVARMFSCYNSILVYALDQTGSIDLASAEIGRAHV